MVLEKLDIQKNETGSPFYITHKNKLKMKYLLKCKTETYSTPRVIIDNDFFEFALKTKATKANLYMRDYIKLKAYV